MLSNRKLHKILLANLAMLFTSCVFAQIAEQPDIHVGDLWSWQHTDALANEKDWTQINDVVEVIDSEIRVRQRVKGRGNPGVATFTREWNPLDIVSASYQPDLHILSFPLQIGKTWDSTADKKLFLNGMHGQFNLKGEVLGYEQVTVPAGTFDAFKVNVVLDAVTADENSNIGHTVETLWYAPSVKNHVKRTVEFTRDGRIRNKEVFELLEYRLR